MENNFVSGPKTPDRPTSPRADSLTFRAHSSLLQERAPYYFESPPCGPGSSGTLPFPRSCDSAEMDPGAHLGCRCNDPSTWPRVQSLDVALPFPTGSFPAQFP
jgi:hypothetical protein